MIIRKSEKADIKVRPVLASQAGVGTNRVLVACDGGNKPLAYITSKVDAAGTLHITRLATFGEVAELTPEKAVNACTALLRELVASNGNRHIRVASAHVDGVLTSELTALGFRSSPVGCARVAERTVVAGWHPFKVVAADDEVKHGYVTDIEELTDKNTDFRHVLYTGEHLQLVVMSLKPDEEIGMEVHEGNDQFFRVENGVGTCVIGGVEHDIRNGSAFVIPAGTPHNVIAGVEGLKVYSLYAPPHHADGTTHKTKADAEADDEQFKGQTTEK